MSQRLPLPTFAADPRGEGLTGLETYLWYADDGATPLAPTDDGDPSTGSPLGITVTATAGPHTITARAWISEYRWRMGDGTTYVANAPGSLEDPAATHVYERKGDHVVSVETVWRGSYTWSQGGVSGSGELPPVTRRSDHDYRVVEARSVLTR